MNRISSIQLKAAVLLLAFGLNTVVGFACAIGVDMGFNATHHHDEETTAIHIHKNGEKHHHAKKEHSHSGNESKDGCCNDKVLTIAQTDKSIPQTAKMANPLFFVSLVTVYYTISITRLSASAASNKYFVRGYHPPIPDIRVAIRSFQI
jgi:ABC-type nickel/cobalt efflux system permease component RcnA